MNDIFYDTIFKRKSFHLFRNIGDEKISQQELSEIEETWIAYIQMMQGFPDNS